jgi:putative ABC transport system permease protein
VTGRAREIAIRASLGATRRRIVRQLMVESLVLALLAGGLGILVGELGVRLFVASFTPVLYGAPPPYWLNLKVDAEVYLFLAAVCLGTSVIFGLAPALHVSRTSINESLKEGGRGSASTGRGARRWTGALVVAQLALTLVLLAGAGMIGRGFIELYRAGQIIDTSDIVTMRLALAVQKYRTPEQRKLFFKELDERLAANRSFSLVTVASDVPFMTLTGSRRALTIEGDEAPPGQPPPSVAYIYIGPRYFETLRVKLTRGRGFEEQDGRKGQEGAIVNERFVSLFFPNRNPIGRRIRLVNAAAPNVNVPWVTIVGVAPTIPQIVIMEEHDPIVYVPVEGEPAPHRFASIIARSTGGRTAAVTQLREEVRRVDPDLPGYYIQTMDELLAASRFSLRLYGAIFLLLAAIALILATVGLFALTAHGVAERTREIGVRMALGAESRTVVWLFVRRAIVLLAIGLTLGAAASLAAGRYVGTFLPRTDARDPLTLAAVSTVLIAVGLAAAVLPARRAARVDPLVALRYD